MGERPSRRGSIISMNYYSIVMKGFDASADARIKTLGGHEIGPGCYILNTRRSSKQIEDDLRQTADEVEITEISNAQFESISREKLGFYAPNPD